MRFLLLPASLLYTVFIALRNKLYDLRILKSKKIENSIGIGNLSMGGTGKTPLTLYLASWLSGEDRKVVILSRGYKRTSRGFLEVLPSHQSHEVGDEPFMYKKRMGDRLQVYVSKDRLKGSELARKDHVDSVILFDDVYQHRKIIPAYTVITSPYEDLFHKDHVLPVGRLREPKRNIKRADCIVITGCPTNMTSEEKEKLKRELSTYEKPIFFSSIGYSEMKCFGKKVDSIQRILLVTGIATNSHLVAHLQKSYELEVISYPDHHNYTEKDMKDIHEKFGSFADDQSVLLTTEKDMVRMLKYREFIDRKELPMYYQPITIHVDNEETFKRKIKDYVGKV